MEQRLLGIHHVSAIARDPRRNVEFYTGVLGLRLVKRTVNFDAPQGYHLYYGDDTGTPGTLLTFFPLPQAKDGRQGVGQTAAVGLAIPPASLGYWLARFVRHGVPHEGPATRFGERVLAFRDPDGLALELVASAGAAARPGRDGGPVPAEHAIRGLHHVTLWEEDGARTAAFLTDTLGFRPVGEEGGLTRYTTGDGGPGALVDVRHARGFWPGVVAAGAVHHVAWRVADGARLADWRERLVAAGRDATDVRDRLYFRSVYFHEPGGALCELATDGPGFAVDEPPAHLGETLTLPPWLEGRRAEIERRLPPLDLPNPNDEDTTMNRTDLGFVHQYVPATAARRPTLLLLHGTGGDETDLLDLGRALAPGAALLSPRGKVLEQGMPRFFRRLAPGVFDVADLHRRTEELADFVGAAANAYGFDAGDVVAVGYSNGANIAASLLLSRPGLLRAAVLFRPMVPFTPEAPADLTGTPVLLLAGRADPIVPAGEAERLAALLGDAGADVALHFQPGGHGLTQGDLRAAAEWLRRLDGGGA
ncbi:MAG TPA: VOC family protein [Thermomicrobiales bacterium]|nr:VOC family protein [Thermomicrobiales bacterium]